MITRIRSKQDIQKALSRSELRFLEEREIVGDSEIRALTDRLKSLLRSQKRIHVSVFERDPSKLTS